MKTTAQHRARSRTRSFRRITAAFIIAFMIPALVLQAQSPAFSWLNCDNFSYQSNPYQMEVRVTTDGDKFLFNGFTQINEQYGFTVFGDTYFRLVDESGILEDEAYFTGKIRIVGMDSWDEGWIVLAEFRDTLTIGGQTWIQTGSNSDVFAMSLDEGLNIDWLLNLTQKYGQFTEGMDAINDKEDGFYLGLRTFPDNVILRFNDQYQVTDSVSITNGGFFGSLLATDEGDLYVAGGCPGSIEIGDTIIAPQIFYSQYLLRLNDNLKFRWIRFFRDVTCSRPELAAAPDGGVYYANQLNDSMTLDGIHLYGPSWTADFVLLRADTNGNILWARETPQGPLADVRLGKTGFIASDDDGNVYLTGQSRGTIQWAPGVITSGPLPDNNVWVMSWDEFGTPNWALSAGSTGLDYGHAIAVIDNHTIANVGTVQDSASFGPLMAGCHNFVIPYQALLDLSTGTNELVQDRRADLTVFPNPAGHALIVNSGSPGAFYSLYTIDGRALEEGYTDEEGNARLDVSGVNTGLYLLHLTSPNGESYQEKVMVAR